MIVIPFFGRNHSPERLRNLLFTHAQYLKYDCSPVVVLTTTTTVNLPSGPRYLPIDDSQLPASSKSYLIRKGLELIPNGTSVLFVDADMVLSKKSVERFFGSIGRKTIAKPHRVTRFLSPSATETLFAGGPSASLFQPQLPAEGEVLWPVYYNQGGAWGFIKEDDRLGELASPTLFGWGVEDSLFSIVAYNLGYDTVHFDEEIMLHLWHPYGANSNSSAEHNALHALRYLKDLESHGYERSSYVFVPSAEQDAQDEGVYRCDSNTLFNLIGDCYFRVLGYSHFARLPENATSSRPKVTLASLLDLFRERNLTPEQLLGGALLDAAYANAAAPKLDRIYRHQYPSLVPTAVDARLSELMGSCDSRDANDPLPGLSQ